MKTFKRLILMKRNLLLLLFPIALVLMKIAKENLYFAENIHAQGIFKVYSQVFSMITGLIPFSMAELFIVAVIIFLPIFIIGQIIRIVKSKGKRLFMIWRDILTLCAIASLGYFLLVVGCQINYYRQPIGELLVLDTGKYSTDELYELHSALAERASTLRKGFTAENEDENGAFKYSRSNYELAYACRDSFQKLAEKYDIFSGTYAKPKLIIHSKFMSMFYYTGVFVPYSMESNVNIDAPAYGLASTMCHEQGHLRGFMREEDANLVGYLACIYSDDPELEYSGLMDALIYVGNELASRDSQLYTEVTHTYDPGIWRDLEASNKYWDQFKPTPVTEFVNDADDEYLKANGQENGIESYNDVVGLLIGLYRKNHGIK